MKTKQKLMSKHNGFAILTFITLLVVLTSTGVQATANGNLEVSNSSTFENSNMAIRCYNLDGSTAYALYQGSTAVMNWTTATLETERTFYVSVSSNTVFYLYSGTDTIDSYTVNTFSSTTFIPVNLIIQLGVSLLVLYIIARVIRRIRG